MNLNAGQKYEIELKMYHSVHNEAEEDGKSFVHLYWSHPLFDPQIIPEKFFYISNKIPPVKLTGYDPNLATITKLEENSNAFINSDLYKISDIPDNFQGFPAMKFTQIFNKVEIVFSSSSPLEIFIALEQTDNNAILPNDFFYTEEGLSVLKVSKVKLNTNKKKIKAVDSTLFKIYSKKFKEGIIRIPISSPTSLILFYTIDPLAGVPYSCGGEEIKVYFYK